ITLHKPKYAYQIDSFLLFTDTGLSCLKLFDASVFFVGRHIWGHDGCAMLIKNDYGDGCCCDGDGVVHSVLDAMTVCYL
nr:hypothetical protein [Tanacetum cinerariifolium]